ANLVPPSAEDVRAGLYEGVIEAEIQVAGDGTTHWPMSLHFARDPKSGTWWLLTSNRYPDDGVPHAGSAERLPNPALLAIMRNFGSVLEWKDWWTVAETRRKGK